MNFAPKSDEKQKQSLSDAMFSQPNLHEDQNKQILFDDFIGCGFIVQYMFYCAIVRYLWDI